MRTFKLLLASLLLAFFAGSGVAKADSIGICEPVDPPDPFPNGYEAMVAALLNPHGNPRFDLQEGAQCIYPLKVFPWGTDGSRLLLTLDALSIRPCRSCSGMLSGHVLRPKEDGTWEYLYGFPYFYKVASQYGSPGDIHPFRFADGVEGFSISYSTLVEGQGNESLALFRILPSAPTILRVFDARVGSSDCGFDEEDDSCHAVEASWEILQKPLNQLVLTQKTLLGRKVLKTSRKRFRLTDEGYKPL